MYNKMQKRILRGRTVGDVLNQAESRVVAGLMEFWDEKELKIRATQTALIVERTEPEMTKDEIYPEPDEVEEDLFDKTIHDLEDDEDIEQTDA